MLRQHQLLLCFLRGGGLLLSLLQETIEFRDNCEGSSHDNWPKVFWRSQLLDANLLSSDSCSFNWHRVNKRWPWVFFFYTWSFFLLVMPLYAHHTQLVFTLPTWKQPGKSASIHGTEHGVPVTTKLDGLLNLLVGMLIGTKFQINIHSVVLHVRLS